MCKVVEGDRCYWLHLIYDWRRGWYSIEQEGFKDGFQRSKS